MAHNTLQSWSYQTGHGVTDVAISADGSRVIAGTLGNQVICLDQGGKALWSVRVDNQAWRVALSANGQVAVVGTGSTRPWDMRGRGVYVLDDTGRPKWHKDLDASVWGIAIAADGNTIAVGTDGHQALLFDGMGNLLWERRMSGVGWYAWVWTVDLSADGQTIAAGSANKMINILDRGGNLLGGHHAEGDVFTVAVSADGGTVAAGSSDRQVYVLDRQGSLLWFTRLGDKVWSVNLAADGQRLVVGAGEKEPHVRVFDRGGGMLWMRHVIGGVSSVAISDNGETVVVGTRSGYVYFFSGKGDPRYRHVASRMIRDVAVSSDGQTAAAASEDGHVYGFALPIHPATGQDLSPDKPFRPEKVYNIHIERGEGIAIGDGAHIIQHFQNDSGSHRQKIEACLGEIERTIQTGLGDLEDGQAAIYHRIGEAYREPLGEILEWIKLGRLEQGEMSNILDAIRRALRLIQTNSIASSVESREAIVRLQSAVESKLGLQQKLELALPIIPLFLEYKIELLAEAEEDLNTVQQELETRWKALLTRARGERKGA